MVGQNPILLFVLAVESDAPEIVARVLPGYLAHNIPPRPLGPYSSHMPIQGYLAHKKLPPPQDHHRALGIWPLQGPRGRCFLMLEVSLYVMHHGYDLNRTRLTSGLVKETLVLQGYLAHKKPPTT